MGAGLVFWTLQGETDAALGAQSSEEKSKASREQLLYVHNLGVQGLSAKGTFEWNATGCFRAEKCHYHVTLTTVMRTN